MKYFTDVGQVTIAAEVECALLSFKNHLLTSIMASFSAH